MKNWYIYILRCKDNTLYTGITNNIQRRYNEHKNGKGAKYTKIKGVERIEIIFISKNRSEASKIEYILKQMKKKNKENLLVKKMEVERFIKDIQKNYHIEVKLYIEK